MGSQHALTALFGSRKQTCHVGAHHTPLPVRDQVYAAVEKAGLRANDAQVAGVALEACRIPIIGARLRRPQLDGLLPRAGAHGQVLAIVVCSQAAHIVAQPACVGGALRRYTLQ